MIETTTSVGACPSCGVLSSRIQARPVQRVTEVACSLRSLDVVVRKRRYACCESLCPRRSFTEETEQLPARARGTTRLVEQVMTAGWAEPRAVSRVTDEASLSWPKVMRMVATTVDLDTGVDRRHARHLGIDEDRFRTVRYLRDADTHVVDRVEPWSIVFTDLDDGAILYVVNGRCGKVVTSWLGQRPRW